MSNLSKISHISLVLGLLLFPNAFLLAQNTQMLSVTPPLFQLSVAPGDAWQSAIRVVNGNENELTVYAEVVNFSARGEHGQGILEPLSEHDDSKSTLASWIDIPKGPYTIPPQQTREIPFFVDVPKNAAPGGHFAAILIGTQPPKRSDEQSVRTSQAVTSLFFARIEGDIIESGGIREFSVNDTVVAKPKTDFLLRFENKGNVHLQPRGNIVITNMWGKERGVIPINSQTHFGNVLPNSIREFNFSWEGESSISEIGRYKAVVALGYGQDGIKNTDATTYFWVIPIKTTAITIGFVVAFILLITWAIKAYVRRMLALAGVEIETHADPKKAAPLHIQKPTVAHQPSTGAKRLFAPFRLGAAEFVRALRARRDLFESVSITLTFLRTYRWFFGISIAIVLGIAVIWYFVSDASIEQKNYQVTIDEGDAESTINSEEVIKESLTEEKPSINTDQRFDLVLVNESGVAGVAATAAVKLESDGYRITSLETNLDATRTKTIIVYDQRLEKEALALSSLFNNALLSAAQEMTVGTSTTSTPPRITIFFGRDQTDA